MAIATLASCSTKASNQKPGVHYNYIAYSEQFASAGQPTEEQLIRSQANGVERVIYLAFSDQKSALPAEDRIVKNLGMSYLQLPVAWQAPQPRDYYLFAQTMQLEPERKTLLHCQANLQRLRLDALNHWRVTRALHVLSKHPFYTSMGPSNFGQLS